MIVRNMLITAICASSCLAAACAGDTSLVAPTSAVVSSSSVSTISGRVTERTTHSAIAGATVTVQVGSMRGPTVVTDASGFYELVIKKSHVTVAVKADRYIDRSESLDVSDNTTRLDFQLMPLLDD